jgi:hypothetical protein
VKDWFSIVAKGRFVLGGCLGSKTFGMVPYETLHFDADVFLLEELSIILYLKNSQGDFCASTYQVQLHQNVPFVERKSMMRNDEWTWKIANLDAG